MAISMECPSCMNSFSLADELAGRKSKCPECQFVLFVPRIETTVDTTTAVAPTANTPVVSAVSVENQPQSVSPSKPGSKRVRTVQKKATAATTTAPSGNNPFDFESKKTTSPRHRKNSGGWGPTILVIFALFALGGLLLIAAGGAGAWYLWNSTKAPTAIIPPVPEEQVVVETPKKIDVPEPPKKELPKEEPVKKDPSRKPPVGKTVHDDPVAEPMPMGTPKPPVDPKVNANPPAGKPGRLILAPIPPQTIKAGDKILLSVSIVREDCKGPVIINATAPVQGISVATALTLPPDIEQAKLGFTTDPTLAPGLYRIPVSASLNPLTDSKAFELTVEKSAAPVVVKPPPADPGNGALQIANTTIHLDGHAYTANSRAVESVALSLDAKWAVAGSADGTVNLWDVDKGRVGIVFTAPVGTGITAVAISPDAKWAASGDTLGTVRLHGLDKKETIIVHKVPANLAPKGCRVNALEFSAKGELLVVADQLGVSSFEVPTGKQVSALKIVACPCLHFAVDGSHVIAISGKKIAVCEVRQVALPEYLGNQKEYGAHYFACYPAKQELIALIQQGKQVAMHRINEKAGGAQELVAFPEGGETPVRVAVADKARYAVTSDKDGVIRGWNLDTGKELFKTPAQKGEVHGLAVSADGHRLITGGADGSFRVIDLTNDKPEAKKPANPPKQP